MAGPSRAQREEWARRKLGCAYHLHQVGSLILTLTLTLPLTLTLTLNLTLTLTPAPTLTLTNPSPNPDPNQVKDIAKIQAYVRNAKAVE